MKKTIAFFLILAMMLALCACGSSGSSASTATGDGEAKYDSITLTMAVNGTDTQIDTKVANYFKELVEEESQGSIIIEVYPNDQLAGGNATKGIEMIADGSTDLAAYATSVLSVLDERLSIGTVPWMFNNYTEARETIDATGLAYYDSILQQQGITAHPCSAMDIEYHRQVFSAASRAIQIGHDRLRVFPRHHEFLTLYMAQALYTPDRLSAPFFCGKF